MDAVIPELSRLTERLLAFSLPDGGLPYYLGNASSAEPTALGALALRAAGIPTARSSPLALWLAAEQNKDGSLGISPFRYNQGIWLTALAALVFNRFDMTGPLEKAISFILSLRSATQANDPKVKQDSTIVGWPWVRGTFGWVEPTAWALLALSASGRGDHPRAVEGRKFLLDRKIPSGGWNYGNPGVNDSELLAFFDTTGLALTALAGQVPFEKIRESIAFLEHDREKIASPCGLGWAVIGLEAWNRQTARLKGRLRAVLESWLDAEINAANLALGIVALSAKKVLTA